MSLKEEYDNQARPNSARTKIEWKYLYRDACASMLIAISTVAFALIWRDFVSANNQSGHLLGSGNIGTAVVIYAVLFFPDRSIHRGLQNRR